MTEDVNKLYSMAVEALTAGDEVRALQLMDRRRKLLRERLADG